MTNRYKVFAFALLVITTGLIVTGCSGGDDLKPVPEDPALSNMPAGEYVPPPGGAASGGQPMPGSKKGGG